MAAGIPDLSKRKRGILVVVVITFAMLALLGFWVGLFETFGGYVWRREMFFWIALLISLLAAALACRSFKVHAAVAAGISALSMIAYGFGTAAGEAFYIGPKDMMDFVHLVALAINNQL